MSDSIGDVLGQITHLRADLERDRAETNSKIDKLESKIDDKADELNAKIDQISDTLYRGSSGGSKPVLSRIERLEANKDSGNGMTRKAILGLIVLATLLAEGINQLIGRLL